MADRIKHYCAENQRIASKVGSGYESKDSIDRKDRNVFSNYICIFLIINNLLFSMIINKIQKNGENILEQIYSEMQKKKSTLYTLHTTL
jgi:hypothetical protein